MPPQLRGVAPEAMKTIHLIRGSRTSPLLPHQVQVGLQDLGAGQALRIATFYELNVPVVSRLSASLEFSAGGLAQFIFLPRMNPDALKHPDGTVTMAEIGQALTPLVHGKAVHSWSPSIKFRASFQKTANPDPTGYKYKQRIFKGLYGNANFLNRSQVGIIVA